MEAINLAPLVRKVACDEHIIQPEIKYKYSNEKGDGYLGVVKAIEVCGKNKSLEVIVKFAADSDNLRKQAPIREAFLSEMWFYDKIMPAQLDFQVQHNVQNPFVSYAKCYGVQRDLKQEILLFENLKQYGYEMWDRKKPMNHEHLNFVFQQYGRYHATNFAMKKLNPTLYKELSSKLVDMMGLFVKTEGFGGLLDKMAAKVSAFFDPIKDRKYFEVMSKFNTNCRDKMLATGDLDDYCVILHGDCWCNNMMFKYKDLKNKSKPDSMQLIDFQLCKQGSPVLDLSYFFYVCADKPSFLRLEEYLKSYHESFTAHLADFGLDSNDIYPFSKLKEHWKRYSRFGYFMAIFLIKIMISGADEVPDLADVANSKNEESGNVMESFDFECRDEGVYQQRIRDLVYHLVDNGFVC